MKDTSQQGQSAYIMSLFGGEDIVKKIPKYAIEIGAFDGVTNSNVKPFFDLGWHGTCIEPDPLSFNKLKDLYLSNDKVHTFNICIYDGEPSLIDFYGVNPNLQFNDRQLSTLSKKFSDDINGERGTIAFKVKQLGISLHLFYKSFINTYVSYVSIDCECYDEKIIFANDFSIFRPCVIQAEFQYDEKIENIGLGESVIKHLHNVYYDTYRLTGSSDILMIDKYHLRDLELNILDSLEKL